tara:strand:- start:845 stop:1156 length:312 start_codon:yes stop_codon:yes gene_type:complete
MYKPLRPYLTIKESLIHGLGVFATEDLCIRTNLGISHVGDFGFPDDLIRTPLGGFINDSDEPNCELKREGRKLFAVVIKKIKAGEEITLKYGRTKTLFVAPVA